MCGSIGESFKTAGGSRFCTKTKLAGLPRSSPVLPLKDLRQLQKRCEETRAEICVSVLERSPPEANHRKREPSCGVRRKGQPECQIRTAIERRCKNIDAISHNRSNTQKYKYIYNSKIEHLTLSLRHHGQIRSGRSEQSIAESFSLARSHDCIFNVLHQFWLTGIRAPSAESRLKVFARARANVCYQC